MRSENSYLCNKLRVQVFQARYVKLTNETKAELINIRTLLFATCYIYDFDLGLQIISKIINCHPVFL